MSGKKFNVYIRRDNLDRWERPTRSKSEWVNKMLEREAEEEVREAKANPVFDEVTQTWSDAEL